MEHITDLEKEILFQIAQHEYSHSNGSYPETIEETGTFYWIEDFTTKDINVSQVKGIVTSLVKKELVIVTIENQEKDRNTIDFTKKGFELFKKLFSKEEFNKKQGRI